MLLLVQVLFQRIQPAAPQLPIGSKPGIQLGERLGAKPVPAPLPVGPNPDEPGVAQHPQVLRNARLAEPQLLDELADGPLALTQKL